MTSKNNVYGETYSKEPLASDWDNYNIALADEVVQNQYRRLTFAARKHYKSNRWFLSFMLTAQAAAAMVYREGVHTNAYESLMRRARNDEKLRIATDRFLMQVTLKVADAKKEKPRTRLETNGLPF